MGLRKTGTIEGLQPTFGFIQCCDGLAGLFFHFTQFEGNIEHLKIGDQVEFELSYDWYGRPMASAVSKIAPEEVMSDERVLRIKEEPGEVGARPPVEKDWDGKRKAGEQEAGRAGKVGRFQDSAAAPAGNQLPVVLPFLD